MPELPEVQTIVNALNNKIKNQTIINFWSDWEKNIKCGVKFLKQKIKNQKIINARRIGKHIIIDLGNAYSIIIHLKMTGHLLLKNNQNKNNQFFTDKVNQYIHHIFFLKNKNNLEFSDLRKFGWINLVKTDEVENQKEIKKLGIDATSPKLSFLIFNKILDSKPNQLIGLLLLNQDLISGIGNIYRSEILSVAQVNPLTKIKDIKLGERKKIFLATKKILKKAIKMRGTSDSDYRSIDGKPGEFQNVLQVYRKDGENCKRCKNIIKRVKIVQRSAFYCPTCQEL